MPKDGAPPVMLTGDADKKKKIGGKCALPKKDLPKRAWVAAEDLRRPTSEDTTPEDDTGYASRNNRFLSVRTQETIGNGTITKQLSRVDLFKECTGCFLEALAYHLEENVFQQGTEIIRQGDIGNCMYLLNFGEVDVLIGNQQVAVLGGGQIFGEMSVLSSHAVAAKRAATIRAKTTCLCWAINRPLLLKVLASFPTDEAIISAEAERRLRVLRQKGLIGPDKPERQWTPEHRQSQKANPQMPTTKLKALTVLKKAGFIGCGFPVSCPAGFEIPIREEGETGQDASSQAVAKYERLEYAIKDVILPNYIVDLGGYVVPKKGMARLSVRRKAHRTFGRPTDSKPHDVLDRHRREWSYGETMSVAKTRRSAMDFLAQRGQLKPMSKIRPVAQ